MKTYFTALLVIVLSQSIFSQNFEFSVEGKQLTVIENYESGDKKIVSQYTGKKLETINSKNYLSSVDSKQIKLHGLRVTYYKNGQVKQRTSYKKGAQDYRINERYTSNGEEVFTICDLMPAYKDGQEALFSTINNKLKSSNTGSVKGVVFVSFIVTKEGKITEVKSLRGINPEIDKVATDIVENLGLFNPAVQDGKPVNCIYNLPIRFE